MKLEREAKQSSEMVDRRENEASSNQMKADGREIDRTSGPFRAGFQKNLANQTSSLKTSLSRSALEMEKSSQTGCLPSSMTPLKSMRSSLAKRAFAELLSTKKTGGYWLVP